MAAGQASARGADVILFERKSKPARKLGISGKGRCNLTNEAPLDEFIARFGANGKFLRASFHSFFSDELIEFFNEKGVKFDFERGGRVFPVSDAAGEIVNALIKWVKGNGVRILTDARVKELILKNNGIAGIRYAEEKGESILKDFFADRAIIATGGASYPATGSTGDGYKLAESAGHSVIPIRPALVPLETKGDIARRLQGLSVKNVKLRISAGGKKVGEIFGEMLFTHFGVSGPIVLSISKTVVDLLNENRKVKLVLDLKPALDEKKLDNRLLRDLNAQGNKKFKTVLKMLLPQKLIPVCIEITRIPADNLCNQIGSAERKRLRLWLKNFELEVIGYRTFNEAIITAGGVNLKEVNPKTMESRLIKNLYFAGEVLDIDADTGGFNLQAAFSTGYLAGISAAK